MKIYDISMEISHSMPVYKGKEGKRPLLKVEKDHAASQVYESGIEMNLHTGTHVDAPLHMIVDGETIDSLDLAKVVTKCRVLDLTNAEEKISRRHLLDKSIRKGEFVLLKTLNSFRDILEGNFIYLDHDGADYLRSVGVSGVGIDALGIERAQPDHPTHKTLMEAGIVIIEGLRLADVSEGEYILSAAPLKIAGAEAAPARAVLIELQ
jgi:arylformamidase